MVEKILKVLVLFIAMGCSSKEQTNDLSLEECYKEFYSGEMNDLELLEQRSIDLRACMIGKKFPSFSATTISGKTYSTDDLEGKVVFVTSWFSSCAPCVAEIPVLNELSKQYKSKDFLVLSFSTDDAEGINRFLVGRSIDYEIFPDSKELIENKIRTSYGYPTNFILNKKGEIVEFVTGGPTEENALEGVKNEFATIIERELAK